MSINISSSLNSKSNALPEKKKIPFSENKVRSSFPLFKQHVCGMPIAYLDNAATSQKPKSVIDRMNTFYLHENSNIHRGVYFLSEMATKNYEDARQKVCRFIGTQNTKEIIFTRGTTESINLVMNCWGRQNIKENDEIIVTRLEHHSNFVPWQILAKENKAHFKIAELLTDGTLDLQDLKNKINKNTKFIAITHMSNALGAINPIDEISQLAKKNNIKILVDAAQSAPHFLTNLKNLGDIDFLCFSSHKIFGPTGMGVLWAKEEILQEMSPYQYGGDMIKNVYDDHSTWNDLPWKYEAGTPHIAGAIGLGAALDFIEQYHISDLINYEHQLASYFLEKSLSCSDLKLIGRQDLKNRGPVFSFLLKDIHSHDLATYLDREGICIRVGHHCAQPLMSSLKLQSTARASLAFYNNKEDIDRFFEGVKNAITYFK